MAKKEKTYERGNCLECSDPMLLKPPGRQFCKARCRYRHKNKRRPQSSLDVAIKKVSANLITIPEAVALGYGKETTLRSRIKRGELAAVRIFGRVLINKEKKDGVYV